MRVKGYSGIKFAAVKEMLDGNAQKYQIEEKIKAAEEISKLIVENAARREIVDYIRDKNSQRYQDQRQDVGVAGVARF